MPSQSRAYSASQNCFTVVIGSFTGRRLSYPAAMMSSMESPVVRFAEAVRALGLEARRNGLRMPAFRSPPRLDGVDRSVRRRSDGGATIAVVVRGRPWAAVVSDMVEGVVVANGLSGVAADRARAKLWAAVGGDKTAAA